MGFRVLTLAIDSIPREPCLDVGSSSNSGPATSGASSVELAEDLGLGFLVCGFRV